MNLFEFEFLKLKENLFFQAFFILSILLIFFAGAGFSSEKILNYSVNLGYIDEDLSEKSRKYLEQLDSNDILELIKLSDKNEGIKLLEDSKIESFVVIPKGYFEDILNQKLEYHYLEHSVIAPAILDLLAENLMLPISKQKLLNATEKYLSRSWKQTALEYYDDFIERNVFYLDADINASGSSEGLNAEYDAKKIELGRNLLGFGMALIILILVFSLVIAEFRNAEVIYRNLSINGLYFKNFVVQRFCDYAKLAILWIFLCSTVGVGIALKFERILMIVLYGLVAIWLYYELISCLYCTFNKSHVGNLISTAFVMLSAIFGGAYFPTDIFPELYSTFLGWIPFYQLNQVYYSSIAGVFNVSNMMYFVAYILILGLVVVFNYRCNAKLG